MSVHNEKIENLLQLIKDNPGLKILPMVDGECVPNDDYSRWTASWGEARIDEYYIDDERVYFKSEDFDVLVEKFWQNKELTETEEQAEKMANEVNWVKAIIVNIDPA